MADGRAGWQPVKGIAIYMEGGGDSAAGKASLRQGMSEFLRELREAARKKRFQWKVVACGSRNDAFDAFQNAVRTATDTFNVLLVDSEGAVSSEPRAYLQQRDGWACGDLEAEQFQLMAQTMETWIVADPEALLGYYGQGFNTNALPRAQDLETLDKASIASALASATRNTRTKREYHKIAHASALLALIDGQKVRKRCKHCERLFVLLGRVINDLS